MNWTRIWICAALVCFGISVALLNPFSPANPDDAAPLPTEPSPPSDTREPASRDDHYHRHPEPAAPPSAHRARNGAADDNISSGAPEHQMEKALTEALSLPFGSERDEALRALARHWALKDSPQALAWIDGVTDSSDRQALLEHICLQLAENDPSAALTASIRHGSSGEQQQLTTSLIQQWAEQDPDAAISWVTAHPPGFERDQWIGRIAFVQSQFDPGSAATLVSDQMSPGQEQAEAALAVLHQWARLDLASAEAWVDRFPPGALQDQARQELARIGVLQTR